MASRFARNVAAIVIGQAALLALWLVLVRTVFRGLGGEALAILYLSVLIGTVTASIGEVGISTTVVREVASHFDTDAPYVVRMLRTFALAYWAAFAVLAPLLWAVAPVIVSRWLDPREMDIESAVWSIRVVGVGALLSLPRSLYASLFRGLQRMEISTAVEVTAAAIQQIGAVAVLALTGRADALFLWWGGAFAVGPTLGMLVARRHVPPSALLPGWFPEVVGRTGGYTTSMLLVAVLSLLYTHVDKIVVGALLRLEALGYYGIAFSAISRCSVPANAVAQAAFPTFAARQAAGDQAGLLARYRAVQDAIAMGTVPLFAAVPFFGPPLLSVVLDATVARELEPTITLLALAFYLNGTLQALSSLLLAMGRPGIAIRFNAYALLGITPLLFLLVRGWGVVGAGVAWIAYHALAYAYSVPRMVRVCLQSSPAGWYAHAAKTLGLALATYGVARWAAARAGSGLEALALAYVAATLVFAVAAPRVMAPELRHMLLDAYRSWWGRWFPPPERLR